MRSGRVLIDAKSDPSDILLNLRTMTEFKICSNCFNPRICKDDVFCEECNATDEQNKNEAHWEELPDFDIWGFCKMTDKQLSAEAYNTAGVCFLNGQELQSAMIKELAIRAGLFPRDNRR